MLKSFFTKKKIYLDYAAATPTNKKVYKSMKRYFLEDSSNAGAIHDSGVRSKKALEDSRNNIKKILNASESKEVVFTSGGTESNSLAIIGYIENFLKEHDKKDINLFTSSIEHPSVLQIFKNYQKDGLNVFFVKVKKTGQIDLNDFKEKFDKASGLKFVSFMYINNETGIVQPIKEVSKIIKQSDKKDKTVFHTDACQAPLYVSLDVNSLGVDMLSLCSQKIYGPKGTGCLYIKKGIEIKPMFPGGSQENSKRAGTENIPLIIGFSKAMTMAIENKTNYLNKITDLKNFFLDNVLKDGHVELNGERENAVPVALNLSFLDSHPFANKSSEEIVLFLNSKGIYVSSKSACMGSSKKNSEVIESMGLDRKNSIRFSLGSLTTKQDLERVISLVRKE